MVREKARLSPITLRVQPRARKVEVAGEVVAVALCSSENLTLEEIQTWSLDFLSDYKTPRNLKILEELPKNAMGKVVKPEIKKLF